MDETQIIRILEALLFVTDKPLSMDQAKEVLDLDAAAIKKALKAIEDKCKTESSGYRLKEVAGGYQYITDPALAEYVKRFIVSRDKRKLSGAGLETLSIIAYKQPITRAEIEYIRGVNVDGAMKTLLEKGLIKVAGKKDVPGKPLMYGTTKHFLDHFGIANLKDLPELAEFKETDIELPESLKHRPSETENQEQPSENAQKPL